MLSAKPQPATARDTPAPRIDVETIRTLVDADMRAVDRMITDKLRSDVALINQLGAYIIHSGGKRLRPMIALLSAGAVGYRGQAHVALATIIEFIHTATLLHDDVVDSSEMRRGRASANELWGNEASVLVGDFLYSRAFELMVEVGSMRVMEVLSHTTNTIAAGEVMQLMNCHSPDIDEARYMEIIRRKTAKLFESAAQLGAVICGQPADIEAALASYGLHLGNAFQLIDDVLDYSADAAELGKNVGDDLAEGKPTLPLIQALQAGNPAQRQLLRTAIENGGLERMQEVVRAIESTGALAYTARRAEAEAACAKQALRFLPDSASKQALLDLADFSVTRTY